MKHKQLYWFLPLSPGESQLHIVSSGLEFKVGSGLDENTIFQSSVRCFEKPSLLWVHGSCLWFYMSAFWYTERHNRPTFYLPWAVIEKKGASKAAGSPFRK